MKCFRKTFKYTVCSFVSSNWTSFVVDSNSSSDGDSDDISGMVVYKSDSFGSRKIGNPVIRLANFKLDNKKNFLK